MSESADIPASGLPTDKSPRVVSHETAIAPEDTMARLSEVLELSDSPIQFEEAFAEFYYTDKAIHSMGLVVMDQLTESTTKTLDSFRIMTQKLGRFCGVNIEA